MARLDPKSMEATSHSSSALLTDLLEGPLVRGAAISREELRFGDYTVAITEPGSPRMPNGIESPAKVRRGARVLIGGGRVVIGRLEITPGPEWNPVPVFGPMACLPAGLPPARRDAASDAALAGYVAGLVLLQRQRTRAADFAERAIPSAPPTGATMLRHAARGEVPEPVHELLAARDASRLISWSPLGISWLRGFVSAGLPLDLITARVVEARQSA